MSCSSRRSSVFIQDSCVVLLFCFNNNIDLVFEQVWDGAGSGRRLRTYASHNEAVRDACWLPCGRRVLSASFDKTACVTDVETGVSFKAFLHFVAGPAAQQR